jgi:hypothetical protein
MASWIERYRREQAKFDLAQRESDPLLPVIAKALAGFEQISTRALLDLLGMAQTSAVARRIAPPMIQLGFVPIRSRTLPPGGKAGTTARGWARSPLRAKNRTTVEPVARRHDNIEEGKQVQHG